MSNNETSFIQDIEKYSKNIDEVFYTHNCDLNLNLIEYNDIQIVDIIKNWKLYLGMIGKSMLFKSKDVMKVIYCYLSDCKIVNSINNNHVDIDMFDNIKNKFYRLETVHEKERLIKIKRFPICNSMIVIDNKNLNSYKIYELYNIDLIKEYYGTDKVNFDRVIKDIKLDPFFVGDFNKLEDSFKILSIINYKIDHDQLITQLEKFLVNSKELEKCITKEYDNFYKMILKERGNENKKLTYGI